MGNNLLKIGKLLAYRTANWYEELKLKKLCLLEEIWLL